MIDDRKVFIRLVTIEFEHGSCTRMFSSTFPTSEYVNSCLHVLDPLMPHLVHMSPFCYFDE